MASSGTKDRPPHSRAAQRVPHWPAATFLLRGLQGLTTCLYPLSVVKTRQMALEGSQSGLKVRPQPALAAAGAAADLPPLKGTGVCCCTPPL